MSQTQPRQTSEELKKVVRSTVIHKGKAGKMIESGNRIRDDANFERDRRGFFKSLERIVYEGKTPPMERYVDFGLGYGKEMKNHQKCHGGRRYKWR